MGKWERGVRVRSGEKWVGNSGRYFVLFSGVVLVRFGVVV